jgi:CPA2 family monovalent cation:H+ antiporter-2
VNAALLLRDLAVVLGAAAVTTVLFQRLRLPVVLGYLIAGVLVGPHVPPGLVSDEAIIRLLSELGVILLLFCLGLDFNLRRLARLGPTAGLTCLTEVSLMLALGYGAGRLLDLDPVASLFLGGAVAVSSSMIVAKVFEEQRVEGPVRDLVLGVLVFEDLVAGLLLAGLTAVGSGAGLSSRDLAITLGRLGIVLLAFLVGGMLVVPRAMRLVASLRRRETLLVASIGVAFGIAWLMGAAGFSVALGAFLAGSLVAESGVARMVEEEVRPVRDMFAAIFFVAVGMEMEPSAIADHWGAALGLAGLVLGGKLVGVSVGAFLTGSGVRTAARGGLSLAQIGEFSFIIAGLGVTLGAAPRLVYTLAIAVSAITAFISPWLTRMSEPFALWIDRKLPHSLQTFASLYASWIELLRQTPRAATPWRAVRRSLRLFILDALLVVALLTAAGALFPRADRLAGAIGVPPAAAKLMLSAIALALATPFLLGLARVARGLGRGLAEIALPPPGAGKVDNALPPRRVLTVTLQLLCLLLVGIPLVALAQPLLPRPGGIGVVAVALGALAVLAVAFWRSATDLEGHLQAGAEVVVAALAKQSALEPATFGTVRRLLPGLGDFEPVLVEAGSAADGRTLGALNLRGRTGATVVAVLHGDQRITVPDANTQLAAGDRVALTGSHQAVESARGDLRKGEGR